MIKNFKKRFLCYLLVIISIFSILPVSNVSAAEVINGSGGWAIIRNKSTVVDSNGGYVGNVFALEGVTVLSVSGNTAYIEYSTSGSPKRGYINTSAFYYDELSSSCVGRVLSTSNTYYSPSTALYAGSVNTGEYVSVLSRNGSWAYIEYNVSSNGTRKRAYVPSSNLYLYNSSKLKNFYQTTNTNPEHATAGSTTTVYAGPSTQYPVIGQIDTNDSFTVYSAFWVNSGYDAMLYVAYPAGNQTKYGYIYVKGYF